MAHAMLANLSDAQIAEARPWLQFLGVEAGAPLLLEGQDDAYALVLVTGALEVHRHGFLVDELGPGDVVGARYLFSDEPAREHVIASTPCRVILIDDLACRSLAQSGHPIATVLERIAFDEFEREQTKSVA
ncbi:MAG: cyclic nucleotide-binding domain-containing protein [Deltaproteobacteria bacterium]|nr:MAG: cyclic nucleotide-binding domain-containing protein [Deltaproteobacteria bacterium]